MVATFADCIKHLSETLEKALSALRRNQEATRRTLSTNHDSNNITEQRPWLVISPTQLEVWIFNQESFFSMHEFIHVMLKDMFK